MVPESFDVFRDDFDIPVVHKWIGGETEALKLAEKRLEVEKEAFMNGLYLPNQISPNLKGVSRSLSAALRFGCLSVKKFYWDIHDLHYKVQQKCSIKQPSGYHLTGQLIWREYFYTMSVRNPNYAEMNDNPICLNIPWYNISNGKLERWKQGKTGFPIIDAAMRQLLSEGWIHHTLRNMVAT